jgi:tetratricopeptide (TPR) repeat protein
MMKRYKKIVFVAIFGLSFASTTFSQQRFLGPSCPDVSSLKPSTVNAVPRSAARIESDKLVVEGSASMSSLSHENLSKAISIFEQAVKIDPTNAAAFFSLSRAHGQSNRYMSVPGKIANPRAWDAVVKGRELEPANIDGLHLLADRVIANSGDYKCAKKMLEAALKLDPKNARSHHYYSQLLSGMGKFDLAFQHADKATALADAGSRNLVESDAGRPRYFAKQYDWVLTKYYASNPDAHLAHFYRSLAYGAKGMFQEALAEAKKAMPDAPKGDAGGIGMLALAYANASQKEKARELLNELLQRDARGEHVVEYRIAAVYEVLGEKDEAFRWLDKQIDDRTGLGSWLTWINYDPIWNDARSDRRWKSIKRRSGW